MFKNMAFLDIEITKESKEFFSFGIFVPEKNVLDEFVTDSKMDFKTDSKADSKMDSKKDFMNGIKIYASRKFEIKEDSMESSDVDVSHLNIIKHSNTIKEDSIESNLTDITHTPSIASEDSNMTNKDSIESSNVDISQTLDMTKDIDFSHSPDMTSKKTSKIESKKEKYQLINFNDFSLDKVQENIEMRVKCSNEYEVIKIFKECLKLLKTYKIKYICGHNIINFDMYHIAKKLYFNTDIESRLSIFDYDNTKIQFIDSMYLSMLLHANKDKHKLEKPYLNKIYDIEYKQEISKYSRKTPRNNPLQDSMQTCTLFKTLDREFSNLDSKLKEIFIYLTQDSMYFKGYFDYNKIESKEYFDNAKSLKERVKSYDKLQRIECDEKYFEILIKDKKIELAFVLSLLLDLDSIIAKKDSKDFKPKTISHVIIKKYPYIKMITKNLTFKEISKENLINFIESENFFKKGSFKGFRDFECKSNSIIDYKKSLKKKKDSNISTKKFSQLDIIESSLKNNGQDSILAILPTGGGKTFTFMLPALLRAKQYNGLSVVISPLLALMKNHIDIFSKINNFKISCYNSDLSAIEREITINEIYSGDINVLYLAPESLRSNTIFKALSARIIDRFIIDEAHCLSVWGHDFRHDYFFIPKFIKKLQDFGFEDSKTFEDSKGKSDYKIPVSLFSATAKLEARNEIKEVFEKTLNLTFKDFISTQGRKNLHYKIIDVSVKTESKNIKLIESSLKDSKKYKKLLKELEKIYIEICENRKNCIECNDNTKICKDNTHKSPTIIYSPQNAALCTELQEALMEDLGGLLHNMSKEKIDKNLPKIEPFYADRDKAIESNQRKKDDILQDFIDDKIDIVIATTAFGMGIDKDNIKNVIHFGLSDSLESYLQESGRGARREDIQANCIVLYDKTEIQNALSKLKILSDRDIKNVEKYIKSEYKRQGSFDNFFITPYTIMQCFNNDEKKDYETRKLNMKTSLLELEKANILERDINKTYLKGTSLRYEVKINDSNKTESYIQNKLNEYEKNKKKDLSNFTLEYKDEIKIVNMREDITRIMNNICQKSKVEPIEMYEVFERLDIPNIPDNRVHETMNIIKELGFVDDDKDMEIYTLDIRQSLEKYFLQERKILAIFDSLIKSNHLDISNIKITLKDKTKYIKMILRNIYSFINSQEKNVVDIKLKESSKFNYTMYDKTKFNKLIILRQNILKEIINFVFTLDFKDNNIVEFAKAELLAYIKKTITWDTKNESDKEKALDYCLQFLHNCFSESFRIKKGRVLYCQNYSFNMLDSNKSYTKKDYDKSIGKYFENKSASLKILEVYLDKLAKDSKNAQDFVKDYFDKPLKVFAKEYNLKDIHSSFSQLAINTINKDLDKKQQEIIESNENKIMILAGPGSGKTRTLVHKITAMLSSGKYKTQNFLMLAHSKVAVKEFKDRIHALMKEVGIKDYFKLNIFTFHSYAKQITEESVEDINKVIENATDLLNNNEKNLPNEIEVLVLDECQDIDSNIFNFIESIINKMPENKKILCVGDDDQMINNFDKDCKDDILHYIKRLKNEIIESNLDSKDSYKICHLLINYRSCKNIVDLANSFREKFLQGGLKSKPLESNIQTNGEIKAYFYENGSFMTNILKQIQDIESKCATIAVLFYTNEEVATFYNLLLENNIKARYILDDEKFQLKDLIEIYDFKEYFFEYKDYKKAKDEITKKYKDSINYDLLLEILSDFEVRINADSMNFESIQEILESYLQDISIDNFYKNQVVVTTLHKAKGKEFDNVFIGIESNFFERQNIIDYQYRLIYVGITRAKTNLYLHLQDSIESKMQKFIKDFKTLLDSNHIKYDTIDGDPNPNKIAFMMTLRDIPYSSNTWETNKKVIENLRAGYILPFEKELKINNDTFDNVMYIDKLNNNLIDPSLLTYPKTIVSKLSNIENFETGEDDPQRISYKIREYEKNNYTLDSTATIMYIVHYKDRHQVLCKLTMSKKSSDC